MCFRTYFRFHFRMLGQRRVLGNPPRRVSLHGLDVDRSRLDGNPDPIRTDEPDAVVAAVGEAVDKVEAPRVLVAVDGASGVGLIRDCPDRRLGDRVRRG
jgi:hypothetical protein